MRSNRFSLVFDTVFMIPFSFRADYLLNDKIWLETVRIDKIRLETVRL